MPSFYFWLLCTILPLPTSDGAKGNEEKGACQVKGRMPRELLQYLAGGKNNFPHLIY